MSEADSLLQRAATARDEERPSEAKRLLISAIALLRNGDASLRIAKAIRALGECERQLGDAAAALDRYTEALPIYRKLADAQK